MVLFYGFALFDLLFLLQFAPAEIDKVSDREGLESGRNTIIAVTISETTLPTADLF